MRIPVRCSLRNVLAVALGLCVLLASGPHPARCAELSIPLASDLPSDVSLALPPDAALDLAVLRAAYPGAVQGLEPDASGRLALVLADGQRLPYDDGQVRDARQALEAPDIRSMLAQVYPLGPVLEASAHPRPDFDPGRARVQALFQALYGGTEAAVRGNCVVVRFDGHGVAFNARPNGQHGAAQALSRVWRRIEPQLPQHPEWRTTLRPLGGSLAWRHIAGTKRLSMHSFGIAIDLNPRLPYWRSEPHPETVPARRLAFPPEILAAFEAEGFIWGGKWASFDLMHFEYRPEVILKARLLSGQSQ